MYHKDIYQYLSTLMHTTTTNNNKTLFLLLVQVSQILNFGKKMVVRNPKNLYKLIQSGAQYTEKLIL